MIYALGYAAVGLLFSLWVHLIRFRPENLATTQSDDLHTAPPGFWRIIGTELRKHVPGIALWPLVAVVLVIDRFVKDTVPPVREKTFAVQRSDLIERLTIEQIEARERVEDPLGAVPPLPFGHLHPAWKSFRARYGPQDRLWSFSAQESTGTWDARCREGYVRVRFFRPGPPFTVVLRDLRSPDGGAANEHKVPPDRTGHRP